MDSKKNLGPKALATFREGLKERLAEIGPETAAGYINDADDETIIEILSLNHNYLTYISADRMDDTIARMALISSKGYDFGRLVDLAEKSSSFQITDSLADLAISLHPLNVSRLPNPTGDQIIKATSLEYKSRSSTHDGVEGVCLILRRLRLLTLDQACLEALIRLFYNTPEIMKTILALSNIRQLKALPDDVKLLLEI